MNDEIILKEDQIKIFEDLKIIFAKCKSAGILFFNHNGNLVAVNNNIVRSCNCTEYNGVLFDFPYDYSINIPKELNCENVFLHLEMKIQHNI